MHQLTALVLLLLPVQLWAHAGLHDAPSSSAPPTNFGEFTTPTSHAGYGYLASSEAQARDAFDFSCSERSVAGLVRRACDEVEGFPTETSNGDLVDNLARGPFQGYLERMLRRQVYEHSALQLFANTGGNGAAIDTPDTSCFDPSDRADSPLRDILQLRGPSSSPRNLSISDGHSPDESELKSMRPPMSRAAISRVATSLDQVSDSRLITGIVTAGYFNRAMFCLCHSGGARDTHCSDIRAARGLTDYRSTLPEDSSVCRSLRHTLFRVKQTYPGIFDEISDTSTSMNPQAQQALLDIVGTMGSTRTEENVRRMLQDTGTDARGPSAIITRVMAAYNTPAGAGLRSSLQQVRARQAYMARTTSTNLCDSTTGELILDNPQAVRQMLIDAGTRSSEERDILRAALCQNSEFRELKNRHCQTQYPISHMTDPDDGEEYQVVRGTNMTDYPFAGEVNYRMRRFQEGGQWRAKVKLRLNFVMQPNATLTTAQINTWRQQAQEYFNQQARNNGRRIDFDFSFTQGPAAEDAININFHQCYCSTCGPNFPATDPRHTPPAINECVEGRANQADSSNFPGNVSLPVIQHEIGHGLGLPDEYSADYYNFNTIGEDDSLMNTNGRMYSRHFTRIMEPNECF